MTADNPAPQQLLLVEQDDHKQARMIKCGLCSTLLGNETYHDSDLRLVVDIHFAKHHPDFLSDADCEALGRANQLALELLSAQEECATLCHRIGVPYTSSRTVAHHIREIHAHLQGGREDKPS